MKNYRLSCFVNTLLIGVITLFLSLISLHFIKVNNFTKILICLSFAISISGFALLFQLKKNGKLMLKEREQKHAELLLKKLEITPDNQLIALLLQIFERANIPAKVQSDKITTNDITYFFDLSKSTSRECLCSILKRANGKDAALFCNKLSDDAEQLLNDLGKDLTIIDGNTLYLLMKKFEVIPSDVRLEIKKRGFLASLLALFKKNFTKKRAVTFTLIGITFCALSKLTFFPKYYLLSALVTLLFALACLIFGNEEKKGAKNLLPLEFKNY